LWPTVPLRAPLVPLVPLLSLTTVVSSSLVLQLFHLALLVRVGGMFFHEDFISGSLNLKLGAPRFSGYLQNRRSCGLLFLFGAPVVTDNGG